LKNNKSKKGLGCGWHGRAPAWQTQGPAFKPKPKYPPPFPSNIFSQSSGVQEIDSKVSAGVLLILWESPQKKPFQCYLAFGHFTPALSFLATFFVCVWFLCLSLRRTLGLEFG
jgi:hypothetical protein